MRQIILLFVLASSLTSCINNDFPALADTGENIFGGAGPDLFELVSVEQFVQVANLRRVRVNYLSLYDEIPQIQRDAISGILLTTPSRIISLGPDRTVFQDSGLESGTEACYSLAFSSGPSGAVVSRPTQFCFQID